MAEVFVLYIMVVVALGVSYPFAPIIHIFQQQTQLSNLSLSLVGECNGSTNVEDTLIYFVTKFIVEYAFLL